MAHSDIVTKEFNPRPWPRLAKNALKKALGLRRGDSVWIETWTHGLPVGEIIATQARRLGILSSIHYRSEASLFESREGTQSAELKGLTPAEAAGIAASDGCIYLPGPEHLESFARLPSAIRRAFTERYVDFTRVLQQHSVPAVWLCATGATEAVSRQFGVDLAQIQREAYRGSAVDPQSLQRDARRLRRPLRNGRRVTITHPNGTRLELGLLGRSPIIDDGKVDGQDIANGRVWTVIPSGYIAAPLDGQTATGRFVSNRPSRHHRGTIRGLTWTFHDGRLVDYSVRGGSSLFEESYRKAGRERNLPALLSVGLNPEIRDFPLAVDQEKGVVTLFIGRNDDFGGDTRGQFREYALLQGADLLVDGRSLLKAGRWR